jgi:hypothetical protein
VLIISDHSFVCCATISLTCLGKMGWCHLAASPVRCKLEAEYYPCTSDPSHQFTWGISRHQQKPVCVNHWELGSHCLLKNKSITLALSI